MRRTHSHQKPPLMSTTEHERLLDHSQGTSTSTSAPPQAARRRWQLQILDLPYNEFYHQPRTQILLRTSRLVLSIPLLVVWVVGGHLFIQRPDKDTWTLRAQLGGLGILMLTGAVVSQTSKKLHSARSICYGDVGPRPDIICQCFS